MKALLACLLLVPAVTPAAAAAKQVEYRAGTVTGFPPYYLQGDQGEAEGFAVDVLNELASIAGFSVQYTPFTSWQKLNEAFLAGEVDIIPSMGVTAERAKYCDFTGPVDVLPISIFVRNQATDIRDAASLEGKTVAVVETNIGYSLVRGREEVSKLVFQTPEEAIFAVLSGRADALIYPVPSVRRLLEQVGLEGKVRVVGPPLLEVKRAVAVRKGLPELHGALTKAVSEYVGGERYMKTYRKWFGPRKSFWSARKVAIGSAISMIALVFAMLLWHSHSLSSLNRELERTVADLEAAENTLKRSEELLAATQKISRTGGWEYDARAEVMTWTDEVYRIHGLEPGGDFDLVDGSLKCYRPEDRRVIMEAFGKVLRRGESYDLVLPFRSHDGVDKWIRTMAYAEVESGEVTRVVGNIMDITDRVAIEQELRKRDELQRETSRLARIGGWEFDAVTLEGKWTEETARIQDLDPEAYTNVEIGLSQFRGEAREKIEEAVREAIEKGVPYDLELPIVTATGRQKWLRTIGHPVLEGGKVVRVRGTLQDITERKEAELELAKYREGLEEKVRERTAELEKAQRELLELDRLKTMFIASMSHELRTPLNSIIGFNTILYRGMAGKVNAEQKKQLGLSLKSAEHLLSLINDIIDLSRIEAGIVKPSFEEFELGSLLREVCESLQAQAREKGIVISQDVKGALRLTSDRRRTRQVLVNLLSNAIKFTDKGSVRMAAGGAAGRVSVTVTDTGCGVQEEDLGKLFRPFIQLSRAEARPREGTGLGLYISRKIADILCGSLEVRSRVGEGTEFTFSLPLEPPRETTG